jgi:hypothetical protein
VVAAPLPAEVRSEFLCDCARALALLRPSDPVLLVARIARAHMVRGMTQMSDGEHYGSSELAAESP